MLRGQIGGTEQASPGKQGRGGGLSHGGKLSMRMHGCFYAVASGIMMHAHEKVHAGATT
jgi:hypothetical protein